MEYQVESLVEGSPVRIPQEGLVGEHSAVL